MALNVLSAADAKKYLLKNSLKCEEGCDIPGDIMSVMNQSATAKELYNYVDKHKEKITLCFFKGPPEEINGAVFDDACETGATVWFNLKIPVYNAEASKSGDLVVPPSLVFFHEFGHAKQWLENKAQFQTWTNEGFGSLGYNKKIEDDKADSIGRRNTGLCDRSQMFVQRLCRRLPS